MFKKLINDITLNLKNNEIKIKRKLKIIFPEGNNTRIQEVANKLIASKLVTPVLCFEKAEQIPKDLHNEIETLAIDQQNLDNLANELVELRKGKTTIADAKVLVQKTNYFAIMCLKQNLVDGFVGGIDYKTSDILRPTLQIIKTKPHVLTASSANLMFKDQKRYIFADCSLNIAPTPEELASIGQSTIELAQRIGLKKPQVAMLSFSTFGSGKSEQAEKVAKATKLLQDKKLSAFIEGEMQFDAAIDEAIRLKKAPTSKIKGSADLFIFPNLESGNIGYKITERLAGFNALGPILLGLNAPVSDLSRGATIDDIYNTVLITAWMATWK